MSGEDKTEESLLARLNALRTTTLDYGSPKKNVDTFARRYCANEDDSEDDLAARFVALSGGKKNQDLANEEIAAHPESIAEEPDVFFQADEDDKAFDEVLADLEHLNVQDAVGLDGWQGRLQESSKVRMLLAEAKRVLNDPDPEADTRGNNASRRGVTQGAKCEDRTGDDDTQEISNIDNEIRDSITPQSAQDGKPDKDEATEDLVRTALEEADIIKPPDAQASIMLNSELDLQEGTSALQQERGDSTPLALNLGLPAAPKDILTLKAEEEGLDALLPAAPRFEPGLVRDTEGPRTSSDEADTWCIICYEDASLQCIDCNGDLYCDRCWVEYHQGESSEFEDSMHKAKRYGRTEKGKEMRKSKRKTKIGAG